MIDFHLSLVLHHGILNFIMATILVIIAYYDYKKGSIGWAVIDMVICSINIIIGVCDFFFGKA